MKKLVLLTSAVILGLTSCSEDETMSVNSGRAIDFRAETASRGSETTTASITDFYVSAYKSGGTYFENLQYSKNSGTGYFESVRKEYWPQDGSTLSFVAYSPSSTALGGALSTADCTLAGFQPSPDVTRHVDFIYAKATGNRTDNEKDGVKLGFNHALSQVVVMAKNAGELTFEVAGIKIIGAAKSGDVNFTGETPAWTTGNEHNAPYKIFYEPVKLDGEAKSLMGAAGGAMVIPQQLTAWDQSGDNANSGAYLAIRVKVLDKDGSTVLFPRSKVGGTEYGWVAVPLDTKWVAGKKYIYTLDFETGAGLVAPPTGENEDIDPINPEDEEDNPKTGEDEKHPGGDLDPDDPKPGDPALGTPIRFTVTVTGWSEIKETPNMDLK